MDFTLTTYKELLQELLANDYSFQTLENFIQQPNNKKIVILRHDVDRLPENALTMARMENDEGVTASYYFRIVKESYDEDIIRQIARMGHEIGYHYENLSEISKKNPQISQINADERQEKFRDKFFELAIDDFGLNLEKLRKFYPVKTICMHGSPLSKWDNRDLWKRYNYRDFGIIAEPYFDVNFDKVFYITDTGRSWNKSASSVRDKVDSKFDIKIKDTNHLIGKIQNKELPDKIMINVHPQRWTDRFGPWLSELIKQSVKNVVKRAMLKFRDLGPS